MQELILEKNEETIKPNYYHRENAMETIDEMEMIFGTAATMEFCKLNAWKYRARALYKNGEEDIKKSDWYLNQYKKMRDRIYRVKADNCEHVVTKEGDLIFQ